MSEPRLSIGLVVYRSEPRRLRATLASLARAVALLRERSAMRAGLVVVDNGAPDFPLGDLPLEAAERTGFDAIERLAPGLNLGYGRGQNLAFERDCGAFHLVMNPDVELAPEALERGIAYLREHPDVAGVVPDGRDGRGAPLYLAKGEPTLLVLLLRALAPRTARRLLPRALAAYELHGLCARGEPAQVPLASGCFMLLRGEALARVGGFSPDYFLYFEDFDLSRRIAAVGPLVYLPAMRIVHHGGSVARKGPRHVAMFCRSALRYFSRWGWRVF